MLKIEKGPEVEILMYAKTSFDKGRFSMVIFDLKAWKSLIIILNFLEFLGDI